MDIMTCAHISILVLCALVTVIPADDNVDKGFDLLFTSNDEEFENYPIRFSHPLPTWVKGTLVHNGLGRFSQGARNMMHAFDGFAKPFRVRITGPQEATFSTRFIRTHFYKDSLSTNTVAPYILFDQPDPPFSMTEELESIFHGTDNTNVNLIRFQKCASRGNGKRNKKKKAERRREKTKSAAKDTNIHTTSNTYNAKTKRSTNKESVSRNIKWGSEFELLGYSGKRNDIKIEEIKGYKEGSVGVKDTADNDGHTTQVWVEKGNSKDGVGQQTNEGHADLDGNLDHLDGAEITTEDDDDDDIEDEPDEADAGEGVTPEEDNPDENLSTPQVRGNSSACPRGVVTSYLANSDFWPGYETTPGLRTVGRVLAPLPPDITWSARFPLPSTSHPIQEYNSSDYISFVSVLNPFPFGPHSAIHVIRLTSLEGRELVATIPVDRVPYMHSFALTRNYAVIFANPAFIDVLRVVRSGSPLSGVVWEAASGTDVHVVDLRGNGVTTLHLHTPRLYLHVVNAWERGKRIVVDYVTYPDLRVMEEMKLDVLRNRTQRDAVTGATPELRRYKIHLGKQTIKERLVRRSQPRGPRLYPADHFDFPAINENYQFQRYCYVYGVSMKADRRRLASLALVKRDMCGRNESRVVRIKNHYFHEPHFIPDPSSPLVEDAGILLSMVLDGERKLSYLGAWDARTMELLGRAYLPTAMPFTLHGHFYSDD